MLGSNPISAILGAGVTATSDTSTIRYYVKALADNGMHMLICKPMTKEPDDLRTTAQIREDDEQWNADNGINGEWREHPKGVHLATVDTSRLNKYINRYRKIYAPAPNPDGSQDEAPISLAINLGPSNLLVADCDTTEQRLAFTDWMAEKTGDPNYRHLIPTVKSPGMYRDGAWIHYDGGHYYFTARDIELPALMGELPVTHNGVTFMLMWSGHYILVPPSVRTEGAYERVGPVMDLKDHMWLHAFIHAANEERRLRRIASVHSALDDATEDGLQTWYNNTPWHTILAPHFWEFRGESVCGCEIWNRPGWSNDRSAVAHVVGCRGNFTESSSPPIHFFTTNPGDAIQAKLAQVGAGSQTLSKLQLYSALFHEGNDGAALRSISEVPDQHNHIAHGGDLPWCEIVEGGEDGDSDADYPVTAASPPCDGMTSTPPLYAPQSGTTAVTSSGTELWGEPSLQAPVHALVFSPENLAPPATFPAQAAPYTHPVNVPNGVTAGATNSVTEQVTTNVTPVQLNVTETVPHISPPATPSSVWESPPSPELVRLAQTVAHQIAEWMLPQIRQIIQSELRRIAGEDS